MSDDSIRVELVAADRLVWSGEAKMVIARTTEGDVGILPNHAPMLSLMVDGVVDVQTTDGETWIAAVDAGFLSVAHNRVSVLSEHVQEDLREVLLVAGRHTAGLRIARVVEALAVRKPGDGGVASVPDRIREVLARGHVAHVQCALLAP